MAITKIGSGTLTLTGTNSYTGDTTVSAGSLKLGNGTTNTALADSSTVSIASSATLELDFPTGSGSSDTVQKLYLGTPPVQVAAGTYDSSTPVYGVYFLGTGSLTVTEGPSSGSPFSNWAAGAPYNLVGADATFEADPDNDGIKNGLEWVLGGNPTTNSSNRAPAATRDQSGNLVLTFTREESSIGQATLALEYDTDLDGAFANSFEIDADGGSDLNGVTVAIDQGATPDAVTVTMPAAFANSTGKIFARLKVTQP